MRKLSGSVVRSQAARAMSTEAAFPSYVLNVPATEVTTLDNGIRVATETAHGSTACVGVYIDAGSRYETAADNGVAHFLEHMKFKGTWKRSRTDIEREFENMGGHLNAYTTREHTTYFARVVKDDIPNAVDVIADMLQNSQYDPAAIEAERGVILRELQEIENTPEEVVFDRLHECYGNSGLGRTILGTAEQIKTITRDQLENFVKTHYLGPRIVVAGAGSIEHDQLVELANKHFGNIPKGDGNAIVAGDATTFTGTDIRQREDDLQIGHVALAFETAGATDPHSMSLAVMQTLLGNWDRTVSSGANMSSPLCRKLAENQLAHSMSAFHTSYADTGLFGVYAVAEPQNLHELSYHILHEMVRLVHDVSDEEVSRAKTQLKTTLLSSIDSTVSSFEDIARQLTVYGRRMTPAEVIARIDAVDTASVKAAASTYIDDKDLGVAGLGNLHGLPDYNWMRRRTYWLRY